MDEEQRRKCFEEFLSTIPRVCSPTMFGMVVGTPESRQPTRDSKNDDEHEDNCDEKDMSFNWSIDQIARLNPADFSNSGENLMDFNEFTNSAIERENEDFFSRNLILPSPMSEPVIQDSFDEGVYFGSSNLGAEAAHSATSTNPGSKTPQTQKLVRNDLLKEIVETPLNTRFIVKKKLFHDSRPTPVSLRSDTSGLSVMMDMNVSTNVCTPIKGRRISHEDMPFLSPIVPLPEGPPASHLEPYSSSSTSSSSLAIPDGGLRKLGPLHATTQISHMEAISFSSPFETCSNNAERQQNLLTSKGYCSLNTDSGCPYNSMSVSCERVTSTPHV